MSSNRQTSPRMFSFAYFAVTVGCVFLATAVSDSRGDPSATGATQGRDVDKLYIKYCAVCHGEKGDGEGKFAYLINPRPRDFQEGKFKLSTTQNQVPTDEDLLRTLKLGMPGSAMPPWDHLPEVELRALVKRVRKFQIDAMEVELAEWVADDSITEDEIPELMAERTEPGSPLAVSPEPPFDPVRWFRGRLLYLENCASCHGADGHPVAEAVKFDNDGYPVPPRSFVAGIFKGGSEGPQLHARIVKGMIGTPMPAGEGVFANDDEIWDVIHYVQSLARAGAQQRAQLRQGTLVARSTRGALPTGPTDAAWEQASPLYVSLTPLWWTEDRIEGLVVKALHNKDQMAIRFAWIDPSVDDRAVRHDEFRDGIAVQFSQTDDPPFYMGDTDEHGGVNIWFWKADRQKNIAEGYQDVDAAFPGRAVDRYPEQGLRPADLVARNITEWPLAAVTEHDPQFITAWGAGNLVADPRLKTPVERLVARGPGTLSGKPAEMQQVKGSAVYERGAWYVQMQGSMRLLRGQGDVERQCKPGDTVPVSFALWNGSAGDRGGKKNISVWQKLVIE